LLFFGRLQVQGVTAAADTQTCAMELFLGKSGVPFLKVAEAI